jgi:hypothetical protein
MRERSTVRHRLEEAAARYRAVTGKRLSTRTLSPDTGRNAELYRRFLARPFDIALGANEGEWIALEIGLKPMVRDTLTPVELETTRSRAQAAGLRVVESAFDLEEDPRTGVMRASGRTPGDGGSPTSEGTARVCNGRLPWTRISSPANPPSSRRFA